MPDVTIHVHKKDGEKPLALTIAEEATIEDLLRRISHEGHAEIFIVVEEVNEPRERHHKLHECGIRHGHHVHDRAELGEVTGRHHAAENARKIRISKPVKRPWRRRLYGFFQVTRANHTSRCGNR